MKQVMDDTEENSIILTQALVTIIRKETNRDENYAQNLLDNISSGSGESVRFTIRGS